MAVEIVHIIGPAGGVPLTTFRPAQRRLDLAGADGRLPVEGLLNLKLRGVVVEEGTTFYEKDGGAIVNLQRN